LLSEIIIPKKRLRGMIIDEYCIIFRKSNSIKKIEGISPSLTSSTKRKPVFAKRMSRSTTNTAIDVLKQFL
tara:strand:- start:410 stop:622 length:213 start_codon:yes stop_codon:yes gene_type:complete